MLTVVELHRVARNLQIEGHWRMNKAELEKATGHKKEVPPHLSFMELLATDYERFAAWQANFAGALRQQLNEYVYDTARTEQMWREFRAAERDVAEACHWAAHYRCQAAL